MSQIELDPCAAGAECADCEELAVGLRKNIDQQPSCLACEADRLAMISLIIEASKKGQASLFAE